MAEEPNHPAPAPSATPASNQNLIMGVVLGAAALLLLLLVISQKLGSNHSTAKDDKHEQMQKEIEEARQAVAIAKAETGLTSTQNAEALSVKIKQDIDALTGLLAIQQENLARFQGSEATVQNLSRQNTELQNRLAQVNIAAQRVPDLETKITTMRAELTAANERLADASDQSTVDTLRQQLNQARTDALNMVDRNQLAIINARAAELEQINLELRAELQKLRAEADRNELFVSSDQLSPPAAKLFAELVRLEANLGASLSQSYERIGQNLNARPVKTMTFEANSSAVAIEHEDHIKKMTSQALGNSFFLVVGYASKTGDFQNNKELSGKRATRVASVVNHLKSAGQDVQAVFLGETSRFGPTDGANQCCEIWEIHP